MAESKSSGSGIASLGYTLIFIALLVCKLTGHFPYSWWWVFSPFWIPMGAVAFFGGIYIAYLFVSGRKKAKESKARFEQFKEENKRQSRFSEILDKQIKAAQDAKNSRFN